MNAMNDLSWEERRARRKLAWALALAGAIIIAAAFIGCTTTVTPPAAQAEMASWDGTNQNSGFIQFCTNSAGQVTGGVIAPHARDRYNALMKQYGAQWGGVAPDAGLARMSDGNWFIDGQHLAYFAEANRQRKNGK